MNLVVPKYSDFRGNTFRPHSQILALLRFYIIKKQGIFYYVPTSVFFLIVLETLIIFLQLIHVPRIVNL